MNSLRSIQTLAAVEVLVKMTRKAALDGKISASEWSNILAYGVFPILVLHGIVVSPPSTQSIFAIELRTEIDRAIANTAKLLGQ